MYELIVIAIGIAAGAGASRSESRAVWAAWAVVALAGAFAVFAASGEIEMGAEFLLWDLGQVVLAGVATFVLVTRLEARRAQ